MIDLNTSIFYLLLIANIRTNVHCSTISLNAQNPGNQITNLQSIQNLIGSSQMDSQINSERGSASGSRNSQFPRLEDPLKSKQEPRWTNPCNQNSFNETLIRVIIAPQSYYPSHIIESERKERGRFLKEALINLRKNNLSLINQAGLSLAAMATATATAVAVAGGEQTERNKRSIITFKKASSKEDFKGPTTNSGQLLNDLIHAENNGIMLKKPKKGAKKTTFSSIDKSYYPKNRSKSREYHSLPLDGQIAVVYSSGTNKRQSLMMGPQKMGIINEQIVTSTETTMTTTFPANIQENDFNIKESPSIKVLQSNGAEPDELLKKIFADDMKMYWHLNRALNTVIKSKRITRNINRLMTEDLKDKDVKGNRFEEILKQRDWLPNLKDLIDTNQFVKLTESRQALASLGYYIQFFSCAFEQMVYDQVTLDKKFINAYRELEKATLRILCDIDSLIIYLEKFHHNKVEFLNEIRNLTRQSLNETHKITITKRTTFLSDNAKIDDSSNNSTTKSPEIHHHNHLPSLKAVNADMIGGKLNNSGDAVESPPALSRYQQVDEANGLNLPRKHDQTTVGIPTVKREIMPRSQRNLNSALERTVRDQSILIEFGKVLSYYHSLLTNIYI